RRPPPSTLFPCTTLFRSASSVLQPGGRLLGKRDFAGVDVAVGHHVHTVELLAAGVQRALGDQRGPRRVFPDLLLRLFVQLRLFLVIDRTQGLGDIGVHYIVLVVGGVVQPGRKRFGCQQRTQRPVGLAGGSGPAGVVHAHGRLGRFGRLLHPFRALPHFQSLHLHLDAHLAQLLLQELQNLLRRGVGVAAPQHRFEAVGIAGLGQQFLGLLGIVGPRL